MYVCVCLVFGALKFQWYGPWEVSDSACGDSNPCRETVCVWVCGLGYEAIGCGL